MLGKLRRKKSTHALGLHPSILKCGFEFLFKSTTGQTYVIKDLQKITLNNSPQRKHVIIFSLTNPGSDIVGLLKQFIYILIYINNSI
jgi:hypothetical protein